VYPSLGGWDVPLARSTLPELLARAVAVHGPRVAIEFDGSTISYAELGARVTDAAARLAGAGVQPGEVVGLLAGNTPEQPVAFFALLQAGAIVAQLSPLDPPMVMARKLADLGARRLVTTSSTTMIAVAAQLISDGAIDSVVVLGAPPDLLGASGKGEGQFSGMIALDSLPLATPRPARGVDDVAVLQFTGGTTGQPKAAMLTHGNLTAAVSAYDQFNAAPQRRIRPGDRVMAVLPLFHIYALTAVLLRTLHAGATLMLRARFDPVVALDDIESGCTHFYGVPTMWIVLVNYPGAAARDWSRLRIASSGGASLPPEISARMHAMSGLTLGGGWGMTETSPAGTNLLPDCVHAPGLIGVPLPGVDVQIVALDDPRRVLPPNQAGELRIRGPNVTSGYWNRPEDNAAAFVDGWFLTGDIGTMAADGQFTLVDRKKEMLISGGYNVYPRVIEDAIHEHPDVHEAAVIGVPDPYRGQAAKAFVSLRPGAGKLTLGELRDFLAPRLGRHELPAQLEVLDELPHTPVGKLAKLKLHKGSPT